jgi:hypothetical protein
VRNGRRASDDKVGNSLILARFALFALFAVPPTCLTELHHLHPGRCGYFWPLPWVKIGARIAQPLARAVPGLAVPSNSRH